MKVLKCHGSGNDFVLVEEFGIDLDRAALARQMCDRDGPLGADGVLFVDRDSETPAMRIFNADGSEAEMCGNGLRCVGRYLLQAEGAQEITVATMRERIVVHRHEPLHPGVHSVGYRTSAISFDPADLPMRRAQPIVNQPIPELHPTLTFTALAAPNPHLVSFVDHVDPDALVAVGERIKTATGLFPCGTNVSFVEQLSATALFVATFERGVGLTNACGTAMTASCIAAVEHGRLPAATWIDVFNPGGKVQCKVHPDDDGRRSAELAGNATFVYDAEVSIEQGRLGPDTPPQQPRPDEVEAYANLQHDVRSELAQLRAPQTSTNARADR